MIEGTMSKFRIIPYAVLSAGLLAAGGASAQSMSSIDAREAAQQERIERGIRDGSLTRSEARRLERGEQRIERYEQRARADGVVTAQERQRLDHMLDREGRAIYRDTHNDQRADRRGWDGRDGWGRDRDHDGGDRGRHEGWTRGEHNGWEGNRPPGIEHRDAREDRRFGDRREDRAERRDAREDRRFGDRREDRAERRDVREDRRFGDHRDNRTASNMQPGNGQHNWGNGGWQHQPQGGNTTPTNGTHNWGNGGWHQPQAGGTPPTTPANGTPPSTGSRNWGGWHTQQASATPTAPATGAQPNTGARNWSGFRTQQASATPTAQPRPTMTRASAPAPSTGGRSYGGRH
jgi:hypothetical protein